MTNTMPVASLFAGPAYVETRDHTRLTRQIDHIRSLVLDEEWRTVQKLTATLRKKHPLVGFPENSVQAQLRNLRKEGYRVERRHVKGGLFEYRALPPINPGIAQGMREGGAHA